MLYFFYFLCSVGMTSFGKYCIKKQNYPTAFNFLKCLGALCVFVPASLIGGLTVHGGTVAFGALYGGFLCVSMFSGICALREGPMALTSMIISFSFVIPLVYGIVFLREEPTVFDIIGLVSVGLSIFLIARKKGAKSGEITFKWQIFVFLTVLSNGAGSVIQKMHQTRYPSLYRNEFTAVSYLTTFVILIVLTVISVLRNKKNEEIQKPVKSFIIFGTLAGVCNALTNFLSLYLSAKQSTMLFPLLSQMNIIGVCLVGRFLFKEKFTSGQIVGIVLGLGSIVLMNI